MMKAKSDIVCDGKWQSFESEAVKEMLKSKPVTIDMRASIWSFIMLPTPGNSLDLVRCRT